MEQWLRGLISCTVSARKTICQREMDALADLCSFKQSLDAKADKQRFFEANHATFMLPKRFEFRYLLLVKGAAHHFLSFICISSSEQIKCAELSVPKSVTQFIVSDVFARAHYT